MSVFTVASLTNLVLIAVAMEAVRYRLIALMRRTSTQPEYPQMRRRVPPNEYPFSYSQSDHFVGFLLLWTASHREFRDSKLTRYVWSARAAWLGLPALWLCLLLGLVEP